MRLSMSECRAPSPLCGQPRQSGAAPRQSRKHAATMASARNCLSFFTFAGNFRADYFLALTDGAIKRSWVRNLEKFQGCLCFPSSWISQFVSLRLSTWKYGPQLKTMGWRQLQRWLELSFEQFVGNFIGSTSGRSRFWLSVSSRGLIGRPLLH